MHKLIEVLVYYIECLIILIIIDEVTWSLLLLINIDSVNIYIQIAYIEYQIVVDIYEVLTKPAYISLLLLCSRAGILLGYCFQLSLLAIKSDYLFGGDLWGGKQLFYPTILCLLKTTGHRGRLPWA